MDNDFLIPLIFFSFLGAIILVPVLAKERTKRSAHSLISLAISRGQELDPSTIARMTDEMLENGGNRGRRSLGNGVILLGLAAGFVGAGYVISGLDGDGEAFHGMMVPAVLVGAVGAAFLLLAIVDYLTARRTA